MGITSGASLLGLVTGLLDSTSMDQLSAAVRDLTTFVTADHEWTVTVRHVHPPQEDPRD